MNRPIRVLLLEDCATDADLVAQALARAGMSAVTHRVDTRDAFIEALDSFVPDAVVTEHALASFTATAALEILQCARPGVPLIVLSGALAEGLTAQCLRAGAEDVVLKSHIDRLPATLDAALAVRRPLASLTQRQMQVLQLVVEGNTTGAIARKLRLSAKTVDTHRTAVMKRLDIHDAVGLTRYAMRVGVLRRF